MAKQPENSNPQTGSTEKPDEAAAQAQYKKRIEDAVVDAQYMLMYASTNCPKDIAPETLEKLIKARNRIEKEQQLNLDDEAEFWLAYQDLRKLIWPVTAESIKANLPTERSSISKARRIVNWYIVFTVFILGLVLFFQIYWVIGNQLSAQLDKLVEDERILNVQVIENPQPNSQKDLDSLEAQLVQTSLIFLDWSSPWNGLITQWDSGFSSKYPPMYAEIDVEIKKIDDQLRDDPDGTKAAESHKDILSIQLDVVGDPTQKSQISQKIALVELKGILEQELTSLDAKKEIIQGQIDEQQILRNTLNEKLIAVTAEREFTLGNLTDQKSSLNAQLTDLDAQLSSLGVALTDAAAPTGISTTTEFAATTEVPTATEGTATTEGPAATEFPTPTETPTATDTPDIVAIQNKRITLQNQIKQIDDLLKAELARTQSADIQSQINDIDNQSSVGPGYDAALEDKKTKLKTLLDGLAANTKTIASTDNEDIQTEIKAMIAGSTLTEQLIGLDAARDVIQGKIESLQSQIGNIQIELTEDEKTLVEKKLKEVGAQIVGELNQEKVRWENKREVLKLQEQEDSIKSIREDSRPAQLAGQFVLVILQSYLLPLLYGILGATTFVLRSLSRQIKEVSYSEVGEIQHLLHISLGALAGILVGWFSFLIPNEGFIGSVSPLAIAFLVGYNIELLFSKMDDIVVTKLSEIQHRTSATVYKEDRTADQQKASPVTSAPEETSEETPADPEAKG